MVEINLHPEEKRQRVSRRGPSSFFGPASLVLTVVFFVVTSLIVVVIVLNQNALDRAMSEEKNYQGKLKSLSEVELQYDFLKDRAAKSAEIFKKRGLIGKLEDLSLVIREADGVKVNEARLDDKGLSVSASVANFFNLKEFLSKIKSLGLYKNGVIESLSFSPDKGYVLQIDFY